MCVKEDHNRKRKERESKVHLGFNKDQTPALFSDTQQRATVLRNVIHREQNCLKKKQELERVIVGCELWNKDYLIDGS